MADNVVEYGIEVKDNSAEAFNGFQKNVEAVNRQLEGLSKRLEEISKAQAGAATAAKENAGATAALKKVSTEIERGFTDLFGVMQRLEENTKRAAGATEELVNRNETLKRESAETAKAERDEAKAAEELAKASGEATGALKKEADANDDLEDTCTKVIKSKKDMVGSTGAANVASSRYQATMKLLRGDMSGFLDLLKKASPELQAKFAAALGVATLAVAACWNAVRKIRDELKAWADLDAKKEMDRLAQATKEANERFEKQISLIDELAAAQKAQIAVAAEQRRADATYSDQLLDYREQADLRHAETDEDRADIKKRYAREREDRAAADKAAAIEDEWQTQNAESERLEKQIEALKKRAERKQLEERHARAAYNAWSALEFNRKDGVFLDDDAATRSLGTGDTHAGLKAVYGGGTQNLTIQDRERILQWDREHKVRAGNETELHEQKKASFEAADAARREREGIDRQVADLQRKLDATNAKLGTLTASRDAARLEAETRELARQNEDKAEAKRREDAAQQKAKTEADQASAEKEREDAKVRAEKERADAKVVRDAGIRVANYQKHEGQFGEGGAGARKFVETYFGRTFSKAEWEEFRKAPENQAIVKAAKTDWLRVQSAETETRKRTAEAEETAAKKVAEEFAPKIDEAEQKRLEAREKRKFDHHDVAAELRNEREARKEARAQERKEKRALELRKKAKEWEQAAKPLSEGGHGMRLSPFQQKAVDMMRKRDKEEHDAQQARLDLERKQREAEEAAKKAAEQRQKMTDALENIDANLVKALTVQ